MWSSSPTSVCLSSKEEITVLQRCLPLMLMPAPYAHRGISLNSQGMETWPAPGGPVVKNPPASAGHTVPEDPTGGRAAQPTCHSC